MVSSPLAAPMKFSTTTIANLGAAIARRQSLECQEPLVRSQILHPYPVPPRALNLFWYLGAILSISVSLKARVYQVVRDLLCPLGPDGTL